MKKQTRKAKREYEKKLAKEVRQNKRAFFRYVNSKLTVRPEISEMQNELGELVDNDMDICSILGKYFNSVYNSQSTEETLCENEIRESPSQPGVTTSRQTQNSAERICCVHAPNHNTRRSRHKNDAEINRVL